MLVLDALHYSQLQHFIAYSLPLFVHADGSAQLQHPTLHINTDHNGVFGSEGLYLSEDAWEHCFFPFFLPAGLLDCSDVLVENISEVVDDIC